MSQQREMDVKSRESRCRRAGFSLAEVVVSLGLISFALVGILGLFPVALNSAMDSRRETCAALIARSIISEIEAGPPSRTLIGLGAGEGAPVDLSEASAFCLAFDDQGAALPRRPTEDQFLSGWDEAVFFARVDIFPDATAAGLSKVQIGIETPASAPSGRRTSYAFVTLIRADLHLAGGR